MPALPINIDVPAIVGEVVREILGGNIRRGAISVNIPRPLEVKTTITADAIHARWEGESGRMPEIDFPFSPSWTDPDLIEVRFGKYGGSVGLRMAHIPIRYTE